MPFLLLWHPRVTGVPPPAPSPEVEAHQLEGGGALSMQRRMQRRRERIHEDDEEFIQILASVFGMVRH